MSDNGKNPDLNFEVGYNLATNKASFSLNISNIFDKIGKRQFGFSTSRWWTRRKGSVDARQGIPFSTASEPDGRELDVRTQRDQQLTSVTNAVNSSIHEARAWVNEYTPQHLHHDKLLNDVKASLAGVLSRHRDSLANARANLEESEQQYNQFRDEHGLKRPARVPLFFLKPIVILLALLLAETVINAFIFAGISAQGMIGGWLTALVISVINIIMGLVLGFAIIRYALFWSGPQRYVLAGVGLVLIAFAVFFNLYVAHFREVAEAAILADQSGEAVLTRDRAPSLATAWPHFTQNPFNIGSVLGIGLLVIGLSIFGVAAYEGYGGFTDPFPGFGRVGKRYFLNQIIVASFSDSAREQAFERLDAIRKRLNSSQMIHNHFLNQVTTAIDFADRLSKAASTAEQRVNNHAWMLISDYRAVNRRVRAKLKRKAERKPEKGLINPGDPPAYFDVDPRPLWTRDTVVPASDELSALTRKSKNTIEQNLSVIDEVAKYISQLRTRIASNLMAIDSELQREAAVPQSSGQPNLSILKSKQT